MSASSSLRVDYWEKDECQDKFSASKRIKYQIQQVLKQSSAELSLYILHQATRNIWNTKMSGKTSKLFCTCHIHCSILNSKYTFKFAEIFNFVPWRVVSALRSHTI